MRIGLATRPQPFTDARGVVRMDGQHLEVVDLDTMEPVENVAGMIWGVGAILMDPHPEEGLFTPEYFDRERDYLVLVIACDSAVSLPRLGKG